MLTFRLLYCVRHVQGVSTHSSELCVLTPCARTSFVFKTLFCSVVYALMMAAV